MKSKNPAPERYNMIKLCKEELTVNNKSYVQIEEEMKADGIDGRTAAAVIAACKKLIADQEFAEQFEYYTTYLSKLNFLYDQLIAGKLFDKAHKVLEDHKKTYFLLSNLID